MRKRAPGAQSIGLDDVPQPLPGLGQVVVEVHATGICGTDLHIRDDEFASSPPVIMGHEVAGLVVEAGPGAEAHVGRRVALETYFFTCDECSYCRGGQRNLCPERRSIGSHVDGGFASHVLIPVGNLHDVAPFVSEHAAALYEPLACIAHCLCDPAVASPGDRALVVGPGAMGILAAQVLRSQGAEVTVSGTARDGVRLAVAGSLGLATVTAESLVDATPEGGFDVVADCSGSPAGIEAGLRATRRGGRYVQIGLAGRRIELDIDLVCLRELTVTSGFASTPRSWQRAEVLVDGGHVRLEPLVSGAFPLARWQDAFERTARAEGLKLVIDPRLEGVR